MCMAKRLIYGCFALAILTIWFPEVNQSRNLRSEAQDLATRNALKMERRSGLELLFSSMFDWHPLNRPKAEEELQLPSLASVVQ